MMCTYTLHIVHFRMDICLIQYQFSVIYPVQMHLTFSMDTSATIIDISDARTIFRSIDDRTVFNFGNRIFSQFHLITTAQIATDPLANALLLSRRRFKITDVILKKDMR